MAHHCGALKLMGSFIQSPYSREVFQCEWRTSAPAYKRHQKRALAQFRRRDGKRFILESLAAAYSTEFEQDGESWTNDERWMEQDGEFWTNDDCSCCNDYDPTWHDDGAGPVDYSAEADFVRDYDNEAEYQASQARFDWGWEVHQEYLNGVRDGYQKALRNMRQWAGAAS